MLQAASDFREAQRRRQIAAVAASRSAWRGLGDDFDAGWLRIGPRLTAIVTAAQLGAARDGSAYVPSALAQQGQQAIPDTQVAPGALAGIAADGRSLDGLLYGAVVHAKTATVDSLVERLAAGQRALDMLVSGAVADAGRDASMVAMTARPRVRWVRIVHTPCCQRCAVLAGRVYAHSTEFQRHPHCFPEGVVTSGPSVLGSTRRWYEGELVILSTASGQNLSLTGNHPVLTSRGWVPANLLQEGDEVLRSTFPEGARSLTVPDHDEVPSRIEDVWGALSVSGLHAMESAPEDFHGDGQRGKVDVVRSDGPFHDRILAVLAQNVAQESFPAGSWAPDSLHGEGSSVSLDLWHAAQTGRLVGLGHLDAPLLRGQASISSYLRGRAIANLNAGLYEPFADGAAADSILLTQGVFAGSGGVLTGDRLSGQRDLGARWDASGNPRTVEGAAHYASVGADLRQRLASQVELDRLVQVRRSEFRGHVYSLNTSEGWHSANNLIVSNCQCTMLPQTVANPDATGIVIGPGDVKDLTVKQRQLIADGRDFNKVVNDYQRKKGDFLPPTRVDRLTARRSRREAVEALTQAGYLAA